MLAALSLLTLSGNRQQNEAHTGVDTTETSNVSQLSMNLLRNQNVLVVAGVNTRSLNMIMVNLYWRR
jgi:hypothetical protein